MAAASAGAQQAPSDPEAVLKAFAASGAGSKEDVSKARQRIQAARLLRAQDDQQRQLANQQQRQADAHQTKDLRKAKQIAGAAGTLADNRPKPVKFLDDRLGNIPTPGGVGIVLVILLVFIFAIVPVNQGYTRLQLFWLTLLGRTELPESKRPGDSSKQEIAPGVFTLPGNASNTQQPVGVSGANETPNLIGAVRQAVAEAEGAAGNILPQLPFGLPR